MLSDFLASLHTRRAAYRGISLALLGIAIFFAVRNGEMYISLLQRFGAGASTWAIPLTDWTLPVGQIGLFGLQVLLTVAFAYLGFYFSTHQSYVLEALLERIRQRAPVMQLDATKEAGHARQQFKQIIWFLIASDVASSTYVIFSGLPNLRLASFANITLDAQIVAALVAWSVLVFVEFKIGPFLLALAETLPAERKQQLAVEGIEQVQSMKHKALGIVTRAARDMDLPRAWQIVQQSAQRQIDEEQDPLMQDFLRELQDIAPAGAGPYASAQPILPALALAEERLEEPPHTVSDGELVAVHVEVLQDGALVNGQDTLQRTIIAMTTHPDISDENLAELLGLKKKASAAYWRLKAQEFSVQSVAMPPLVPSAHGNGRERERRGDAAERRPFPGHCGPQTFPWDGEEIE